MGGPCELQLYAVTAVDAERAAAAAIAEVSRIEAKYSRYRDDSVLSKINSAAGGEPVVVDDETAAMLDYAATAYQQSGGLFDITSGVLRRAWDFKSNTLPSAEHVAEQLPKVGWQKIFWQRPELSLLEAGMELDFGGFGKEYAADSAARVCREQGIAHGLVDLGGDLHVLGPHPDGKPWRVGIRNPRDPEQPIGVISVTQGGLASSGDYERFMLIDDRRYCHILNPLNGWPVQGEAAAITVFAPQCLLAGTAATVFLLKGDQGRAWLEELGLAYCWVDQQQQLHSGGGLDIPR